MSNPNGKSSIVDFKICCATAEKNERNELIVKRPKVFIATNEEFMQIKAGKNFPKDKDGNRIAENGDKFIKSANGITRIVNVAPKREQEEIDKSKKRA